MSRWRGTTPGVLLVAVIFSLTLGTSVAGAHARRHHVRRPSAHFIAQARQALVRYLSKPAPLALFAAPPSATTASSYNWSGWADTSSTDGAFTKVSGAWTTPAVTCTPEDQLTSDWVGLDGYSSSTVEQDGTIGWCFEGTPTYFTWYEMYPAGTVEVGTSLQPGDKITASVTRSGSSYTLKVTDATHTANSFTKTATCSTTTCLDTSAEWISERPAFSIGIAPQADYGKASFSNGTVTSGGKSGTISSFAPVQITMIDATDTYNLDTTSALTGGKAFTTTWLNSY